MDRVNKICSHQLWQKAAAEIKELEKDRIFCGHDVAHFLDVARLAYIENLEKGLGFDRELIYGAALLHDIGRGLEYTQNIPHDQGSRLLAGKILPDCGYTKEEQSAILKAISSHRTADTVTRDDLAGLLYRADKKSRACLFCQVQAECKWSTEKKNLTIEV
ncbi:MAG TPA: HD domain-containing protein [Candidatus Blautia stercoravium]|nr:HD domain-containing protein [Candidatus Blautia stercoravium]